MSTVTKETFWTQIVEDPTLYGTITTEDNLFNYRSDAVWQVMNETFITNGTNFEVTKWEELLGLNVTDTTLNGRKAAILNHITENLPITIGILEQLVKEITNDDYELIYVEDENKINVVCKLKYFNEIEILKARVIPNEISILLSSLPTNCIAIEFLETPYGRVDLPLEVDVAHSTLKVETVHTAFNAGTSQYTEGVFANTNSIGMGQYGANHAFLINAGGGQWAAGEILDANFHTWTAELSGLNVKGYFDGELMMDYQMPGTPKISQYSLYCRKGYETYLWQGKKKSFKAFIDGEQIFDLIPCIDSAGSPAFFNNIDNTFYYANWGSIIPGFTFNQIAELSKLPNTGGSLTISIPIGYETNNNVVSALETARSKGWTLTIQTHTPEESTSTASTFGMRRIWVRKTQDKNGSYVDANGNRFQVEWCVEIYSPENKTPEDLGYEQFRSVESAVEYWELTPYVDPTLEEQFNSNEQE